MGDGPRPLDYEGAEVRPPAVRVRTVAFFATALLVLGLIIGGLGLMVGVLQSDPRRYETTAFERCASNMRQIGSGILLYTYENQGHYPERLGQLLLAEDMSSDTFVCPLTGGVAATGPTTRAVADTLDAGRHVSYVYIGAGLMKDCDPNTVVLYEPLADHAGDGAHVLFGDGQVRFLRPAEAREIVERVAAGERPVVWKGPGARPNPTTQGR